MSVENLTASVGINCINVSWSYAESVESYVVSCGGVTKTVTEMSASFSAEELQITASDVPVSVNVTGTLTETTLSFLGWDSYTVSSPVTDLAYATSGLQLLLYWTAPTTGGYPIQSYAIESSILDNVYSEYQPMGNSEISNFMTPDLVPGSSYRFRVTVVNAAGVSEGAEISDILIVTYPDAPLNVRYENTAIINNICLLWDTPLYNGGSPIAYYVINLYADGGVIYSTIKNVDETNRVEYTTKLPRSMDIKFVIQTVNSAHYSVPAETSVVRFEPLPPSLRVHLSASDYTEGAWVDKSGLGNNATLAEGTAAKNTAGNGIVLDGQTYWTLPPLELPEWTVGVWFKETAPPQFNSCIITQVFQPDTINLLIGSLGGTSSYTAGIYNSGFVSGPSITMNGWTNVQVTCDRKTVKTYINGVPIGEFFCVPFDSGLGYRIGRCWDVASYVTGEIGEVRMYNYPLTQTQVITDYNTSASIFGLTPHVNLKAIPNEPINIMVTPGIASSLVSWTPSPLNASLAFPVTGYKIFCIPDNKLPNLAAADATSLLVTKLKNGTPYSFRVHAINANGMSVTSSAVVPSPPPAAPKVVALRGPGDSVLLTVAGKPQKGSPILHYNFSVDPPAPLAVIPTNVAANSTFGASAAITGLTLGTSYIVSATATSPTGTSLPGSAKPVIPGDLPDAPVLGGIFGIKSVQLSWNTPDGKGLPIIGYTISYFTGTATPTLIKAKAVNLQMIKGLVTGIEYTFSIQAINVKGNSVSSNSITLIPT